MTERIKTIIRVRPFINQDEQQGPLESCINIPNFSKIRLFKGKFDVREFTFDEIMQDSTTEDDLFRALSDDVISDVHGGINRCILTYGQTSSGKTYTLFGDSKSSLVTGDGKYDPEPSDGLVPRLLQNVYQSLSNDQYEIQLQYIQIYNNAVYDLLAPESQAIPESLKLRELEAGQFDCQAQRQRANSLGSLFQLLTWGAQRRVTASTRMNVNSSRSHVLLRLYIRIRDLASTLTFCDLAGSERVSKTQSQGDRLVEAKSINESLSALGNVVVALAQRRKHVPFRDSALTKLLQESLSGNARALLICCVCQQSVHFDESVSSLQFAERCGAIETRAVENRVLTTQTELEMQALKEETVFGRFGLHQAEGQEIGFVRCSCPGCGCKLTVLDDEFADDYASPSGNVDQEVKIGLRCMQDEVQRLRQQVLRYEVIVADMRAAMALLRRNPELAEDAVELPAAEEQQLLDAPEVAIAGPRGVNEVLSNFNEVESNAFKQVEERGGSDQDVNDSVYEIGESQYEHRSSQQQKQLEQVNTILHTIGRPQGEAMDQLVREDEQVDLIEKYLGVGGPKLIRTRAEYPRVVIGGPK